MTLPLESQSFPASEIRGELRAFKRQKCYGYCLASLDETEIDRFLDVEGILNSARTAKDSLGTTAGIFSLNGADFFIKRYTCQKVFFVLRNIDNDILHVIVSASGILKDCNRCL